MPDILAPAPFRALDGNGVPVSAARMSVFRTETDTLQTVYTDPAATIAHPTPILADANGVFPPIYSTAGVNLKVNITDPTTGASLPGYPIDPIISSPLAVGGAATVGFSPTPEIESVNVQDAIVRVRSEIYEARTGDSENFVVGTGAGADVFAKWDINGNLMGGLSAPDNDDFSVNVDDLALRKNIVAYISEQIEARTMGWGQANQDFTGSRLEGTAYQNDTDRPIAVSISINSNTGDSAEIQTSTDGVSWDLIHRFDQDNSDADGMTFIVPVGHYYRVTGGSGAGFTRWVELR